MDSVNGWEAIQSSSSPLLHKWLLPGTNRFLILRRGSVGFLLAHWASFYHDEVERLDLGVWDDWGYNFRNIAGSSFVSNHSSATAEDLNAARHPQHTMPMETFTPKQIATIRRRLKFYHGIIDWGGDWSKEHVDPMHFEIAPGTTMLKCERRAKSLIGSVRGRELLKANPSQKAVILS